MLRSTHCDGLLVSCSLPMNLPGTLPIIEAGHDLGGPSSSAVAASAATTRAPSGSAPTTGAARSATWRRCSSGCGRSVRISWPPARPTWPAAAS
jgi:hypothetical protein